MTDYISREAAIDDISSRLNLADLEGNPVNAKDIRACVAALINHVPAADVRPVRRGTWTEEMVSGGFAESWESTCSICGKSYRDIGKPNFCPNCGAWMEES